MAENHKKLDLDLLQHAVAIQTMAKEVAYLAAISRAHTFGLMGPGGASRSEVHNLSFILGRFDSVVKALDEMSENVHGGIRYQIDQALEEAHEAGRSAALGHVDKLSDPDVRRKVFDLTNGTCAYCATELVWSGGASDQFCIEHVVPASKGGPDRIENYVPSCSSCNNSKKDGHVLVLIQRILNRTPHGLTELSKRMTGEQE